VSNQAHAHMTARYEVAKGAVLGEAYGIGAGMMSGDPVRMGGALVRVLGDETVVLGGGRLVVGMAGIGARGAVRLSNATVPLVKGVATRVTETVGRHGLQLGVEGFESSFAGSIFGSFAKSGGGVLPGAESQSLSRMEYLTQKYGSMTSAERMSRIDKLAMQNYERRAWDLINEHGYVNRYLSDESLNVSKRFGVVRGYSTTIDSDSSAEVARRAQIKPEWGMPKYRTVIPADSINSIRIARPYGDTGSYGWEFFTHSYPEAGSGGWPQFIIDDVNLEAVHITELRP